jgi:hypothetical protein
MGEVGTSVYGACKRPSTTSTCNHFHIQLEREREGGKSQNAYRHGFRLFLSKVRRCDGWLFQYSQPLYGHLWMSIWKHPFDILFDMTFDMKFDMTFDMKFDMTFDME